MKEKTSWKVILLLKYSNAFEWCCKNKIKFQQEFHFSWTKIIYKNKFPFLSKLSFVASLRSYFGRIILGASWKSHYTSSDDAFRLILWESSLNIEFLGKTMIWLLLECFGQNLMFSQCFWIFWNVFERNSIVFRCFFYCFVNVFCYNMKLSMFFY